MSEAIIVALITSGFSLVGIIITVIYGNKKTAKTVKAETEKTTEIVKSQTDLTLYRLEQVEKKQDIHNNLIDRMYAVEKDVELLKENNRVENHRIKDLEAFHKPK